MVKERTRSVTSQSWLCIGLMIALVCMSCSRHPRIAFQVFADIQLSKDLAHRGDACQDTIEMLLSEIWESGFFRDDDLLLEEILDNHYGIFDYQNWSDDMSRLRAFYRQKHHKEEVMLNKCLFRHIAFSPWMGFIPTELDRRVRATLVHELLHDFWFNVLDDKDKARFKSEAGQFMAELSRVVSKQDKMDFLERAGYEKPTPARFGPYEKIKRLRDLYPKEFATELFAILGDRAFSGDLVIPRRFRIYYTDILADRVLAPNLF